MNKEQKDFKFNKRASAYDDGFEGKASRKFYQSLLKQVKLSPNDNVLDVGCGTGALLTKMAASCNINGFGIDIEENMIAEAKKKCPEMSICVSPCEKTPFVDNTFDAMTACMAYHHFSDKEGFAKEAARILKSDGCLYIADPNFPFIIRKAINGVLKLFHIVGYFGTAEEIAPAFQNYGFILDNVFEDSYVQVVTLKRYRMQ